MPSPITENLIPNADADANRWYAAFAANWDPANWQATDPVIDDLQDAAGAFSTALRNADRPQTRTTATVATKNTQRAQTEKIFRYAAKVAITRWQYLNAQGPNPPTQNLAALGIRIPKQTRTPTEPVTDAPTIAYANATPGAINLRVTQTKNGEPTTLRKYPPNVASIQLTVQSDNNPPQITVQRRTTLTIQTNTYNSGENLEIYAQYISKTGQLGPASQTLKLNATN